MSVRRFIEHAGVFIAGLLVAASGAWAALAVFYAGPQVDSVRNGLCALVAIVSLATLAAFFRPHWRWRAGGVHLLLFIVILGWFCSITPSNQRDWQADAAVLSSASIVNHRSSSVGAPRHGHPGTATHSSVARQ